jgi:hypothetical protein
VVWGLDKFARDLDSGIRDPIFKRRSKSSFGTEG